MSLGNSRVPEQSRLNRNFLLIVSIAVMGNAFLSSYAQSALGLLAKDPVFAHKLDDAVTNVDTLLSNVNAGKGTLGKFATDDQAYNNFNTLLKSSNDLVTAIRTDPKKYLVIHMKIF